MKTGIAEWIWAEWIWPILIIVAVYVALVYFLPSPEQADPVALIPAGYEEYCIENITEIKYGEIEYGYDIECCRKNLGDSQNAYWIQIQKDDGYWVTTTGVCYYLELHPGHSVNKGALHDDDLKALVDADCIKARMNVWNETRCTAMGLKKKV